MTDQHTLIQLEQRFVDLETRLAYQEDLIHSLNKEVAEQQKRISRLEKMNELLVERYRELRDGMDHLSPAIDEKPPHY